MRIVICTSQVPFAKWGAEHLTEALAEAIGERGHLVEIVRIPFRHYPKEEILKGYLAWRLINLEESEGEPIDMVIALKFPSFMIPHPHKVTWLVQQFRQVYDLYGTPYSTFDNTVQDHELRRAVQRLDRLGIGESERVFAISKNVAQRLQKYNRLRAQVLYPPPAKERLLYHHRYGDYVLSVSRIDQLKRVDQLIRSFAHTRTSVHCKIAGLGPQLENVRKLIRKLRLQDRVELLGYVSDRELLDLYANALAVYYAPLDEDYGLATVEAMNARKPVLTASDSGGVLEFVEDGVTGLITDPEDATGLAEQIDRLYTNRDLVAKLGQSAFDRVSQINWETTLNQLLGD